MRAGFLSQRGQGLSGVPVQSTRMAKHQICTAQAGGQLVSHGTQLHGVGARFEDSQDARLTHLLAQTLQRGLNRGGVVREVVVDRDGLDTRTDAGHHLHSAFDIFEGRQCGTGLLDWNTQVIGGHHSGQRVELVVSPTEAPRHLGQLLPLVDDGELLFVTTGLPWA